VARAGEDPDWLLDMLQRLTDAPSADIQPMLRAVQSVH
jgi:hypothetical protein